LAARPLDSQQRGYLHGGWLLHDGFLSNFGRRA
jgi:hypothetical protein